MADNKNQKVPCPVYEECLEGKKIALEAWKAKQEREQQQEVAEKGESMEATGQLEADIGAMFDQVMASIDPLVKLEIDPDAHKGLRPELMFMREEMRMAKRVTLAVRRTVLRQLLLKDFREQERELREIGLAYAIRDP